MKNSNPKILLDLLKLLKNFENRFSNPFQRPIAAILALKMLTGSL
jgi:hypothetical protein